jgi:ribosomal protein L11 methyltransferase
LVEFPALDLQWRPGPNAAELVELLHACLDEFGPQAIHDHESGDGWRVFFKTGRERDAAGAALRASFGDRLTGVSTTDVADDEWARRSQANLGSVRVGRIVVAPPWLAGDPIPPASHVAPAPEASRHSADLLVVIDPSTGFGTGHHETTRLCLSLLQSLELTGRRVIDVGTGSGVLAIAAAQLGASSVIAIDEDPEALRNARENVTRNDVAGLVAVEEADLASCRCEPAGVVVANLTSVVIQRHAGRLAALADAGGTLIVSGFSVTQAAEVVQALGRSAERQLTEGDWAACLVTL